MRYTHLHLALWLKTHTIRGAAGVVTYLNPATGTTAPTTLQSLNLNTVVATVNPNTNTPATTSITHMLGLASTDPAQGWPTISILALDALANTSNWFLISNDPNWITLQQANTSQGVDTVAQIKVTIARPHSIVR